MPNYRRWFQPGGTYFFTVVTYHRRPLLTSPAARRELRAAFRSVRQHRPFTVDAIVVLPDHLHAIWSLPPGDADYSTRWRQIKSLVTRGLTRQENPSHDQSPSRIRRAEGAVWQRRFYEHLCRDEDDLNRCADYLHANPVKHGLVNRVTDWPWSSFHRFVRLGEYDCDWQPKESELESDTIEE